MDNSGCTDRRFADRVHAYELGMLSGPELLEFEEHLMSCDHCFSRVSKMEKASMLLDRDPDVIESIQEIVDDSTAHDQSPQAEPASRFRRPLWRTRLIPLGIVAVATLIFLILRPWDIEIRTDKAAYADNRLTIMYFKNLVNPADSARLGEIAAELLITDLSESQYFQVLSSQRLYDVFKLLKFDGITQVDKNTVSLVAKKTGAKWILTGSILQTQPTLVITSQLVDPISGRVIAGQKVSGAAGEDIFTLIDQLSLKVKKDLALPLGAMREENRRVAEVTTKSLEAYRWYLKGFDQYQRVYSGDAVNSFEEALKYDSTFAMAYYYLAILKDPKLIHKAREYSTYSSPRERYYIDIFEASQDENAALTTKLLRELLERYPEEKDAYFMSGQIEYRRYNYQTSLMMFRKVVELDSLYSPGYNRLAYAYAVMGLYDSAVMAIESAVDISPDDANLYDSRGDIYIYAGRMRDAENSYRRALSLRSDMNVSLEKMARADLYLGNRAVADSAMAVLTSQSSFHYRGRAFMAAYDGHLERALQLYDSAIATNAPQISMIHAARFMIYRELGNYSAAFAAIRQAIDVHHRTFPQNLLSYQYLYIQLLAESGDLKTADSLDTEYRRWVQEHEYSAMFYLYTDGCIRMARGDYDGAAAVFDSALDGRSEFHISYMAGQAYLKVGRYTDAARLYRKQIELFPLIFWPWMPWQVQCNYYLGMAYEGLGDYRAAAEQYRLFIERWKDGDPTIPILIDARGRLAKIENRP
jgi:tetratricopeptide (TPR) repeat protein